MSTSFLPWRLRTTVSAKLDTKWVCTEFFKHIYRSLLTRWSLTCSCQGLFLKSLSIYRSSIYISSMCIPSIFKLDVFKLDIYQFDICKFDMYKFDIYNIYQLDIYQLDIYQLDIYKVCTEFKLVCTEFLNPKPSTINTLVSWCTLTRSLSLSLSFSLSFSLDHYIYRYIVCKPT